MKFFEYLNKLRFNCFERIKQKKSTDLTYILTKKQNLFHMSVIDIINLILEFAVTILTV